MNPPTRPVIKSAARMLLAGGVIAYPTEGVFGLGCIADDDNAILRLLAVKRRDPSKGLILIAAGEDDLSGYVDPADLARLPAPDPAAPVTWIVQPDARLSSLVTGAHDGVAIRYTTNPVARAICAELGAPITSTSANLSGRPTARNGLLLRRQFSGLVDMIVPGDCGPASGPSEIRHLGSGQVLRAGRP